MHIARQVLCVPSFSGRGDLGVDYSSAPFGGQGYANDFMLGPFQWEEPVMPPVLVLPAFKQQDSHGSLTLSFSPCKQPFNPMCSPFPGQ